MSGKVILSLVVGTLLAATFVVASVFVGGDRRVLLIGKTTDAHHQIEASCETCHGTVPFAGAEEAAEALNKACRDCHEDELEDADDSHPRKSFRNPRMAIYRERLDVRLCTTCHLEHRPEISRASGVTIPMDYCSACHADGDQDVRADRPSHAASTFDTCASAGCHNFHDNRALYEDFLVRHADGPWVAPSPIHALAARQRGEETSSAAAPAQDVAAMALAPPSALVDRRHLDGWAGSGHASADVGCAACHAPDAGEDAALLEIESHWTDDPPMAVCRDCHRTQVGTFALGRHGMRQHPGIAKPRDAHRILENFELGGMLPDSVVDWLADAPLPEGMSVAEARLPMRSDAMHRSLDCGTCHDAHAVDTRRAAVEACASCHDDDHTRAYFESPHHALWEAELGGAAPPGAGVSCATCHLVRTERRGTITTSHNNNENLRPNEKMIRTVCLDCHGLGFSLDALADTELVRRNFAGRPSVHVESIEWAIQRIRE